MKIANITMHAINNYGSVLQTLATEHLFEQLGCEVETVDYIRETAQLSSLAQIVKYGGPGWRIKCKQLILHLLPKHSKREDVLNEFRKKYLHLTAKHYTSDAELENDPPLADIYCTGSDQTWNTVVQGGVPKAYFLHFAPQGKRRIAFSASFGIDSLPEKDIQEVKTMLKQYAYLSVRELSGLRILQDLGFRNAVQVLDPTLAVNPVFWEKMADGKLIEGDYIFVYQLNTSSSFTEYVNRFSTYKGLPVVYVKSRMNKDLKNSTYWESPRPEQLLSLFKYSTYVITDSFHATAFCLIFHCNFVDIYPEKFPTRLDNVLRMTRLENRHVTNLKELDYFDEEINFEEVDSILNCERNKTLAFLKEAVG